MSDIEKVLGLDLGTNSIGYAIRDLSVAGDTEEQANEAITKSGVLVFTTPMNLEKGKEVGSLASVRTANRATRRRYERRRIRKYELLELLIKHKMVPLTAQELHDYKHKGKYPTHNKAFVSWLKLDFDGTGKPNLTTPYEVSEKVKAILGSNYSATLASPYQLRALAIENPDEVTDLMLGRIAYHFIQRRGYQSNRKDKAKVENEQDQDGEQLEKKAKKVTKAKDGEAEDKKEETKKVLGAIKGYDDLLKAEGLTPGQEIAKRLLNLTSEDGSPERARNRMGATNKFGRTQLREEWRAIIRARGKNPDEKPWSTIEDVIFRNRPLKSQKKNIGRCTLEPTKFRMPISHPVYEYFRIWQVVNNIRYIVKESDGATLSKEDRLTELNAEQKSKLVQLMIVASNFDGKSLTNKVKEAIGLKGLKARTVLINYDPKASISGSPFLTKCYDVLGIERTEAMYDLALRRLAVAEQQVNGEGASKVHGWQEVNHKEVDLFLLWQWLFEAETEEDEIRLYDRLENRLGLTQEQSRKLWNSIKDGYAMLSLKAALNILKMMEHGYRYDQAALFAKLPKLFGYKTWELKGEALLNELEQQIAESKTLNKAVNLVNDWLMSYNTNLDIENGVMGSRYDPTALTDVERTELKKILKTGYAKMEGDEAAEVLSIAEGLLASKLSVGTRNQPYPQDGSKPRQQSIHTFGLYDRKSPYDVVVDFVVNHTTHSEAKVKSTLYNHSDVETTFKKIKGQQDNELPSPITNSLRNPVVLRALNQLRRLVNHLIRTGAIDPATTAIQLELSRELNAANMRAAIQKWQKKQEDEREKARKEINEHFAKHSPGQQANDADILKYRLWKEQNEKCIYTDETISITDLLSGDKYDIEHIIPQSRYPDSEMENLAISQSAFNRQIKKATFVADLPMFSEIEKRLTVYERKAYGLNEALEKKKNAVKGASTKESKDKAMVEKHILKMELDYYRAKIKCFTTPEANFKGGFRKRQARDTDMINKYAVKFLKEQFEMVKGSKGSVTALVRKAWGLQDETEKKDRSTHEHHAVDAIMQTLLFQKGGEKGPYRLLTELGRGDGALYQRYKNQLEKAESGGYMKKELMKLVASKEFTPFGLSPAQMKRLIEAKTADILIYHAPVASPLKQTKKVLRDKQGKKMRDQDGKLLYQTGVGIRAQLHLTTWYGKILHKDENGTKSDAFRKTVTVGGIKTSDINRIVDLKLRSIAQNLGEKYFENNNFFEIPGKNGKPATRVYKVKVLQPDVTYPLPIKKHINPLGLNDKLSEEQSERRKVLWAKKSDNIMIALVETIDKGKVKRDMISLAPDMFRASKDPQTIAAQFLKPGWTIKHVFAKGDLVMFFEKHPDEIDFKQRADLKRRIFRVTGIIGDDRVPKRQTPQIIFTRADWGATDKELVAYYTELFKTDKFENTWKTGRSKFLLDEKPFKLNLSQKGLTAIPIDGKALLMHPDGSIEKGPDFPNWMPA